MKNFVAGLAASALIAPFTLAFAVFPTWFVMLAMGAAHDLWPAVPATGFWTTFLLLGGAALVARSLRGTEHEADEDRR